jgi:adenylylsulfate kinase
METHMRSIAKAISWRIVATLTTMLLVFVFTGNLAVSSGVGLTELLSKIFIYYVHERFWNALNFGRNQRIQKTK